MMKIMVVMVAVAMMLMIRNPTHDNYRLTKKHRCNYIYKHYFVANMRITARILHNKADIRPQYLQSQTS